jgi:hypothetical protein
MKFGIYSPTIHVGVIEAPTWVDARTVAHKKFDEHHVVHKTADDAEATIEVKWEGSDYAGKSEEERRHMLVREKKDNVWGEWSTT